MQEHSRRLEVRNKKRRGSCNDCHVLLREKISAPAHLLEAALRTSDFPSIGAIGAVKARVIVARKFAARKMNKPRLRKILT